MNKYRIYYWPDSGSSRAPLTPDQIKAYYGEKQHDFEAPNDTIASQQCGGPGSWFNSDGVLLVRVEGKVETPCYRDPWSNRPDTPTRALWADFGMNEDGTFPRA